MFRSPCIVMCVLGYLLCISFIVFWRLCGKFGSGGGLL